MSQPRRIVITIERLVLKGVAPGDAKAVSAALQSSLRDALQTRGLPADASIALPSVPRGSFKVRGGGIAIGAAAGQAIHTAIRQGLSGRRV